MAANQFSKDESLQSGLTTRLNSTTSDTVAPVVDKQMSKNDLEKGITKEPTQPEGSLRDTGEKDPDLVDWDGPNDPENPLNWPVSKKWTASIMLGLMTFMSAFGSSVYSSAVLAVCEEFGVSEEVSLLGITFYVVGFALGPLFWGPWSEISGRRLPLFLGFTLFALSNIVVAVGQNIQTILIFRLFGGIFAACTIGIIGGIMVDLWNATERGVVACITMGSIFAGPCFGPIVGGFITQSYLGWRFTAWITLVMAAAIGIPSFFLVPESFGPLILQRKAASLRHSTKHWAYRSTIDEQPTKLKSIIQTYFMLPPKMMIQEPILLFTTLHLSLIYGILYLTFEAFPFSFQLHRGWGQSVGALPFLSLFVGILAGFVYLAIYTRGPYVRKLIASGVAVPEERLPPMIVGSVILPMGLLWFAWTSNENIIWVPQVLAGVPIGAGIIIIFVQGLSYIVDVYLVSANSALAASTFMRSLFGAGFPLFANAMFTKLGIAWASSLLAFLCVAMIPMPIIFYWYGKRIRSWSKFSYGS